MKILIDTSTYPLDDMVDVQICDDSGTVTRTYRGKPSEYLYVVRTEDAVDADAYWRARL